MPGNGLDAEKLQVLGRWAAGLRADSRQELAAAGRGIELLIEEIERLHVLLWGRQLYPEPTATLEHVWARAPETTEPDPQPDSTPNDDLGTTLRRRLLATVHRKDQQGP